MWPSIIQTISVIVAALSVTIGVSAWRRSLIGQKRIELAEQVIEGFHEARNALQAIRSPMGTAKEGMTRVRKEGEDAAESRILDQAYVAFERYEARSEIFSKLMAKRYRFALYFGDKAAEPFEDLNDILKQIFLASHKLARLWKAQGTAMEQDVFEKHLKNMHAAEAIFWEGAEDPDPLNPKIETMLNNITETCRKIVNPRRTLCEDLQNNWHSVLNYLQCKVR
ncbi:hypothetical protein V1T76_06735 [Roseibium sp. FZY0029]|uniref:hypothetical protein n=1 Tax=Roseibium sp. FZY0029 TaxID=3116647 RepID=UPI002EB985E9|nr:hypothetical protein [Roseibium sp. FZY0029]